MNYSDSTQWTPQRIQNLFHKCDSFLFHSHSETQQYYHSKNKILINAFFEPSTRTSLSFESAMKRLGGQVITFNASTSSIKKGEDDRDTIMSLINYGDAIAIRHPRKEFIHDITQNDDITVPIINAGNGDGDHPTQALVDLYTMYKKFGNDFTTKTILLIGDIRYSRTIHSFLTILHHYPETKIYMLPYEGCEPHEDDLCKIRFIHHQYGEDIVLNQETIQYDSYDVVYITRKQKERIQQNKKSKSSNDFCFTNDDANKLKNDAIIMHPLPRNDELHKDVDANHRAYYFKQMEYSVQVRMGILEYIFMYSSMTIPISTPFHLIPQVFLLSIFITYFWIKNM